MNGNSSNALVTVGAVLRHLWLMTAVLALSACGGHSSTNNSSYTVGGTITGLTSGTVVLVYNGSTTVSVAAGATTWVFSGSFAANSSYSVTVETQPAAELCEVTAGGSGTALTANIDNIAVTCSVFGQWTWEAGFSSVNAGGVYGTQGAVGANNVPGARKTASSWTDSSGNLWLFGGYGYDSTGNVGTLDDLWRYSPSSGQWTWINGDNTHDASGVYGTLATAAAGNVPGGRYSAASWIDSAGNLWLFGGFGSDATGAVGYLNDLWQYSPSSGQWTWVSGGNAHNATGVYGTLGTAAATNVPGARYAASSWIDSTGNLWLFGGVGYDSAGAAGDLNDLWRFSPATGQWTWVSGSHLHNANGVYGTLATSAAANIPGARQAASSWIDSSGLLWLFGGYGYDGAGDVGYLNDLWQYSPSTAQWTWVSGGDVDNAGGVYGTQGTAGTSNVPGARQGASSWIDASGRVWLYGGAGHGAAAGVGDLNDLWRYDLTSGEWTWVSGGDSSDGIGLYGTQGAISASTVPGARQGASSWIDASGHLWLFGGAGFGASGNGYLNDLWQFVPP